MPSTDAQRPLRLAVYGFVEKEAGGLASANFVFLKMLLDRGNRVDFYAVSGSTPLKELRDHPNLRYFGFSRPILEAIWKVIDVIPFRSPHRLVQTVYSQVTHACYNRTIARTLRAAHRDHTYDVLLVLGMLSPFDVPGLATVSWEQGTPNGEWEALENQRAIYKTLAGRFSYFGLKVFYLWRQYSTRRRFKYSNLAIYGSRWAVSKAEELGMPPGMGTSLPYPVDLAIYTPAENPAAPAGPVTLLHLGRLVPRKRLDLLLKGFQLLRRDDPDVRLRVIGSFAYASGYRKLLADERLKPGVEYQQHIPRTGALDALKHADILVQPSENENFGTAVAEAQACGLPVVLGPTNGTGDYIDRQDFTFDRYEPAAVAQAMARAVAACRTRRSELNASARESAMRHFDVEKILDRLIPLLWQATRGLAK